MIEVINLSTGDRQYFLDLPPEKAVTWAYLQSIGKNNTWEYNALYPEYSDKLIWGKLTVALGDFCAFINN